MLPENGCRSMIDMDVDVEVGKAMEDVWRWKDEIAKETEGMTSQERIANFRQDEQRLADKSGGEALNVRWPNRPRRPYSEKQN